MKYRIKLFLILFVVCFIGIVTSTILIDKQIDSYIEEMRTNIDINIEVVNNSDNNVTVKQDDDNVTIYIDPNKSDETTITKDRKNISEYITVVASSGLNIREYPTVKSEKVGSYYYGERVKVLEDCGDWYRTEFGFIYKLYTIKI